MGKRTPATTRSTYIRATKAGGTKMPSGSGGRGGRTASQNAGMYGITMPGNTRQSSNYAVQGTSLMEWEEFEGGTWRDTGRTLGPQDYEPAPAPAPGPAAPAPAPGPAPGPASNDSGQEQQTSWTSYANPAETQAMNEAEAARVTRTALLKKIEDRRKLRLKDPRKFGRFSLISNLETGVVPSLLGG